MEILLERVKYLCNKYEVTIYALEKATGLSDSSVKRWNRSVPSGDKLLKVARYFGVSVDFLLGNTDNPKSHLNVETIDQLLSKLNSISDSWNLQVSTCNKSFCEQLNAAFLTYGIQSDSKLKINSDEIMQDPALPKTT